MSDLSALPPDPVEDTLPGRSHADWLWQACWGTSITPEKAPVPPEGWVVVTDKDGAWRPVGVGGFDKVLWERLLEPERL